MYIVTIDSIVVTIIIIIFYLKNYLLIINLVHIKCAPLCMDAY